MTRALLRKCIREGKWLLLGTGAAISLFCWVRVWMISRLDASRFEAILNLLPGDWKRFAPVAVEFLITYTGRVVSAYSEPIVVFGVCIWAIARASDCVSGELQRGTLEMLLAQPLSRWRILWTHSLVTIVGTAILASCAWLGTWIGLQSFSVREEVRPTFQLPFIATPIPNPLKSPETRVVPLSQKVRSDAMVLPTINLFALGFFFAGFTTLVSAFDRYRWRTIGIVAAVLVSHIIFKLVGRADLGWDWLTYGSVISAYEPEHLVYLTQRSPELTWAVYGQVQSNHKTVLGPLGYYLILLGLGHLAYVLAAVIFQRRDLPAPL